MVHSGLRLFSIESGDIWALKQVQGDDCRGVAALFFIVCPDLCDRLPLSTWEI